MRIKIFLVIVIAFTGSNIWANKLVVAKTGGGYTTVQAGVTAANAGDTVLVKAGVYNEAVSFAKSGSSAGGYITLLGETGAILDGTGKGETGISISNQSNIRVIGLEVQYFTGSGTPMGIHVDGNSSNLEIRNMKVHNIENATGNAHGIALYGTAAVAINNVLVDGNEIRNCKLGQSEAMVLNGNVTNFTVSNNTVHDNDNIGIDFIGFEGTCPTASLDQARDGVCINNTVYNTSSKTNPTYGGDQSADGIYVDGGKNIVIERNRVSNCDIGIEVASEWKGKTTQDITVRNNFISGSFQANIMAGGYDANRGNALNITIVNNTTYQGTGGELALQYNCNTIQIKNNIFYGISSQDYLQNWGSNNLNVSVNNNIYYGQSTSSPGDWVDAGAYYVNPLLVNGAVNMHIGAASPAINAGIDLGNNTTGTPISGTLDIDNKPRKMGVKVDIGADEYETPSSVINHPDEPGIRIYPNPATNRITVVTPELPIQSTVILCTIDGKELLTRPLTGNETQLDIHNIPNGVYFVKLMMDKMVVVRKILVN